MTCWTCKTVIDALARLLMDRRHPQLLQRGVRPGPPRGAGRQAVNNTMRALEQAVADRDRARDLAVALEQHLAAEHARAERLATQAGHVLNDLTAANKRAEEAEAELADVYAALARVEALCDTGVFNVREWGERGTPFSNGGEQAFRRVTAALADTSPAEPALHAWTCPDCGAETRARMADHDPADPPHFRGELPAEPEPHRYVPHPTGKPGCFVVVNRNTDGTIPADAARCRLPADHPVHQVPRWQVRP